MAALYFLGRIRYEKETGIDEMLTKVLDTVWTHKGYTGSCYVENVEMIFKVTGTMIPGPTIEGYKQAWVSVSNTMILMNSVMQLCNEIIVAKNNGGASNQQMGDCQLLMRTYLDCLKKSGGYVASVMRNSFVMQGYLARYDSALNNCASHSRYFSDELDAQIFCLKKEHMFTYGTICVKI